MVNPVIYAEFTVWYGTAQRAAAALGRLGTRHEQIPREALFLAGKAFRRYQTQRGTRTGVVPGFFIGGHAAVRGSLLLTCARTRFRICFPTVSLLVPATR